MKTFSNDLFYYDFYLGRHVVNNSAFNINLYRNYQLLQYKVHNKLSKSKVVGVS